MKKNFIGILCLISSMFAEKKLELIFDYTIPQKLLLIATLTVILGIILLRISNTVKDIFKMRNIIFIGICSVLFICVSSDLLLVTSSKENGIVEIVATGEANEKAHSSEIWISAISSKGVDHDLSQLILPAGWRYQDGCLLATGPSDETLTLPKEWQDITITFNRHAWCGIVEIRYQGETKVIDTYTEMADSYPVHLSKSQVVNYKTVGDLLFVIEATVAIFTVLFIVYGITLMVNYHMLASLLALGHWGFSFFIDRIFFNYDTIDIWKIVVYKIIFLAFLILIWHTVFYIAEKIRSKDEKILRFLRYFLIYLSINIVILVMIWPGNYVWDELWVIEDVHNLTLQVTQHYFTSVLYILSLMLIPFPAGIVIVQVTIISTLVGAILANLEVATQRKWISYILMGLFLLPPALRQNYYPLRTSIYGYLELFIVLYVIKQKQKIFDSNKNMVLISLILSILSVWRSEGILILIIWTTYCLLCFVRDKSHRYQIFLLVMASLLFSLLLKLPQYILEEKSGQKYAYPLAAYSELMDDLVKKEYEQEGWSQILKKLDTAIDVQLYLESANGERAYWNDSKSFQQNAQTLTTVQESLFKLMVKYPQTLIRERIMFFLHTAGGLEPEADDTMPFQMYDEGSTIYSNPGIENFRENYRYNYPANVEFRGYILKWINMTEGDGLPKIRIGYRIFYNIIPGLIAILLYGIYSLRTKQKESILISIIYLVQFSAVFMLAPGQYFMYYFPHWLFGNTLIVLFIISLINKKIIPSIKYEAPIDTDEKGTNRC